MKSISRDLISADAQRAFHLAAAIVDRLPDARPGEPLLRCHEVARAVGAVLGLEVIDGQYGGVDHSWLRAGRCILDVYAVGQLPQVRVLDTSLMLPHLRMYRPGPARTDIMHVTLDRLTAAAHAVLDGLMHASDIPFRRLFETSEMPAAPAADEKR